MFKLGRWYIALLPLLLIGFVSALLLVAAAGQSRLKAASDRLRDSQVREQALNEFLALIINVESEQRGYRLTGEQSYFESYRTAALKVEPALDRLEQAYPSRPEPMPDLARLRELSSQKLDELERMPASGQSDAGQRTTRDISSIVALLRERLNIELAIARTRWRSDLRLSQWVTLGGALLNIGLVVLATGLVYADMKRRARLATALRDQKQELADQVDARTRELTALSTHLQGVSEQEKSALSRELHDALGGLLVAARMDLSWLQQRLPTSDPAIEQRFKRIHESLSAGVDLKRRVVEELRPTLLDNMGLFTALRWQFKESCRRTGLTCSETIPEIDLKFSPDAAIGVFRVAQEALINILKHANAKSADLAVDIQDDTLILRVSDDGKGIPTTRLKTTTSHGLASMRHRIAALGGTWDVRSPVSGGTIVTARIPMNRMLATDARQFVPV